VDIGDDSTAGREINGKIYEAQVRNGINGPVAVYFNAADAKFNPGGYQEGLPRDATGKLVTLPNGTPVPISQSPVQSGGVLWTLNGAATVVDGAVVLNGVAGTYVSTPDSPANSITGDIDIRVKASLVDWTPTNQQRLVIKADADSGPSFAYIFAIQSGNTGALEFYYSTSGTVLKLGTSSEVTGFADMTVGYVRVTLNTATGNIKFYTSSDGQIWAQLGAMKATAAGAIFDSTAILGVGGLYGATTVNGKIYEAEIRNGIDGPVAVSFNAVDSKVATGIYNMLGGLSIANTGLYTTDA